ncbi:sensor histidine kinase [Xylanimonas ulmi]|uniref:histidine kinase n=1 Tax=Xylanimonas ulmi TaxID=228973 RepID=A0A4Q7M243_9MICO|nr:ATP-binding protein [Xylanibacterium ulmi]RZS61514.1 histidine kinase/DNA gyrase B/HSP90-like ATPase [Xylanibacterium ulmi]
MGWIDGVTHWPYLALTASGLGLLAMIVALAQAAQIRRLRRQVRRLERLVREAQSRVAQTDPAPRSETEADGEVEAAADDVTLPAWLTADADPHAPSGQDDAAPPALESGPPDLLGVGPPDMPDSDAARALDVTALKVTALDKTGLDKTGLDTPTFDALRLPAPVPDPAPAASGHLTVVSTLRGLSLIGRQLELLDEMERREAVPETLAALFQIDNLTMRLRRSAESALILAGREPSRRAREALTVSDTVRTACAQIERYERVSVDAREDPVLRADVVVPLAHLLAEVLDNATRFSDPETAVRVLVEATGSHVVVVVEDHGIGLDTPTLDQARAQLRGDAPWAGSARIGFAVISQLARRVEANVEIDSEPGATRVTIGVPVRWVHGSDALGLDASLDVPTAAADALSLDAFAEPALVDDADASSIPGLGQPVAALPGGQAGPMASAPHSAGWQPEWRADTSTAESAPLPTRRTSTLTAPAAEQPSSRPAPAPSDDEAEWIVPQRPGPGLEMVSDSSLQDEVIAELSRLSGYRPAHAAIDSGPLERRTPARVGEPVEANRGPAQRDAADIQRRMSAFQSSVRRGRSRRQR